MSTDEVSGTSQTQQYRLCELELSDDGSSSVISEPEREQRQGSGRRRALGAKQRRGSSTTSAQISPVGSGGSQRSHGSPLPAYPVSIRQQLAIIKQMEQPTQPTADSSSASGQLARTSSVSPGLSKRRIPKVHKKNERGETPLHVAARKGEHRLCRKLIQEGALVNARDYAGWTPLHEACYHGHFKIAKLLIGYEADVNALSDCDDTPLHDAVTSGNEKLVWLLLHAGAVRDRADNDGKRPIDLCNPEHHGIRNLLTASTVPDRCPIDESPSLSPSTSSHTHDSSQLLTVNLSQFGSEKQSVQSPSSDGSIASADTFMKEGNAESGEELRLQQIQGSCEQPMMDKGEENATEKAKANNDCNDVLPKNDEPSAEIQRNFDEIDSSFAIHRPLWPEDSGNSLKIDESHPISSPYEFDDNLASTQVTNHENTTRFGLIESKEGENRRIGRPRGSTIIHNTERSSPQQLSQKLNCGDKRKQRGRKRGRGMTSATNSAAIAAHNISQADDVYEFRSSPESDIALNKTGSTGDMEREMSESPNSKKQRFNQTGTAPATFTFNAIQSQTCGITQEGISMLEKDDALDAVSTVSEQTDEKSDAATVGRKVPPLRISLPRTPSEDGAATITTTTTTDDVTSVSVNAGRRNTRSTKSLTKKNQSPEQSTSGVCDESVQRVTRSKLRLAGRQLRDQLAISYETSVKRKSGTWRRGSTVTALPVQSPSIATSDEHTTSCNDAGDRPDAEENPQLGTAATPKDDENALIALSLMKKNSYEGYRGFRSLIEERWAKDAAEEKIVPECPPNFDNYKIVQGNYVTAASPNSLPPEEEIKLDFMEKITAKLRALQTEQQEKRRNMQIYHQVERERLQMQAESEVLRMLSRKANQGHGSFSAMRMIRETNLFNTGFLEVKPKELRGMEVPEIKAKFEKLADAMRKRQQMEADALYAEQVFVWNAAVRRSEDPTLSSFKDAVPRVSVSTLTLNL